MILLNLLSIHSESTHLFFSHSINFAGIIRSEVFSWFTPDLRNSLRWKFPKKNPLTGVKVFKYVRTSAYLLISPVITLLFTNPSKGGACSNNKFVFKWCIEYVITSDAMTVYPLRLNSYATDPVPAIKSTTVPVLPINCEVFP